MFTRQCETLPLGAKMRRQSLRRSFVLVLDGEKRGLTDGHGRSPVDCGNGLDASAGAFLVDDLDAIVRTADDEPSCCAADVAQW